MIEQAKVALFYIVSCLVYFIQPKLVYVISTRLRYPTFIPTDPFISKSVNHLIKYPCNQHTSLPLSLL